MRIDTVDRDSVSVIYAASPGDWKAIPAAAARAFERLEAAIPPSGRKVYGYWHPPELEYRACYERLADERPEAWGSRKRRSPAAATGAHG